MIELMPMMRLCSSVSQQSRSGECIGCLHVSEDATVTRDTVGRGP